MCDHYLCICEILEILLESKSTGLCYLCSCLTCRSKPVFAFMQQFQDSILKEAEYVEGQTGKGRQSRAKGRQTEKGRKGLGNPSGNLSPGSLGSFGRSDDLSKIRTSIVHLGSSLNQTPSHLFHLSHVTVRPKLQFKSPTTETKNFVGTREIIGFSFHRACSCLKNMSKFSIIKWIWGSQRF